MEILENRRYSVSTEQQIITFERRIPNPKRNPPYKTDLHASKTFIIEFDSMDPEDDADRDFDIWDRYAIKTVRLPSIKVINAQTDAILREIHKQLSDKTKFPDEYKGPRCNHCKIPIRWEHPKTGKPVPHPETKNPQPLMICSGKVHHGCMLAGTIDGAYYKDRKKYFGGAATDY